MLSNKLSQIISRTKSGYKYHIDTFSIIILVINDENSLFPIILDDFVVFSKMSQNLVEQLAARRRARGQALNSTLLAVMKEKDDSAEKTVISPPSKKV